MYSAVYLKCQEIVLSNLLHWRQNCLTHTYTTIQDWDETWSNWFTRYIFRALLATTLRFDDSNHPSVAVTEWMRKLIYRLTHSSIMAAKLCLLNAGKVQGDECLRLEGELFGDDSWEQEARKREATAVGRMKAPTGAGCRLKSPYVSNLWWRW